MHIILIKYGNYGCKKLITLFLGDRTEYKFDPYYMGLDPVWQISENKITFLNTYKMKISLIFGLIHMVRIFKRFCN
jgi:vacuolar-type H+-ATPase subunit I/STV1